MNWVWLYWEFTSPSEQLKPGSSSSPCCLCFCWWTKLWDLTKRIKMTAVNETQLGLDHNRQNCNPPTTTSTPLESQIHKYINSKTQAHEGRAQPNGHICCLSFFPSNLRLEAKRQAATRHHRKLITGFNIPVKWTRLIYVLSVGFEVFSPTGHTEYNNATVSSIPPILL